MNVLPANESLHYHKIIYTDSGDLVMHDIIFHIMDMILFYKDEQEERTDNECKLVFFSYLS